MSKDNSQTENDLSEIYEKLFTNPEYYSELLLKIKTKDAKIVPLFYNRAQKYAYNLVQKLRAARKPVRIVCVKPRQVGISTVFGSLIYQNTATRSNITSMISSHDQDSSNHIYGMYQLFYDKTDDAFKPMKKYSNRKELLFENPSEEKRSKNPGLNSRIIVETAKNTSLGRSFTLQNFHGTEVAYWEKPEEVMMGVEEAVPYIPDTLICLESTANGIGDYFHKKCELAAEGKSEYQLLFMPWYWEPGYTVKEKDVKLREQDLGDHAKSEYGNELELFRAHNVSLAQIQWRRDKIINSFDGNLDRFAQEYPVTWREAFIFSGQPLFNSKILLSMKEGVREPVFRGDLRWDNEDGFAKYKLKQSSYGALKIWEMPKQGEIYTLGADVSEGVEGGDNSVVQVLRVRNLEQVAEWCGLIDPDDLSYVVYYLGMKYFKGLAGVEVNNHGLTTVVTLQKLKYWNQYKRVVFDKVSKKRRDALGWKTSSVTKPLMIDGLRKQLKESEILLNSKELIDEMLSYVLLQDGKMGALPGKHDDRVIAMAIAVEMAKQTYIQAQLPPEKPQLKSKFTFDFFDQMAENLEREKNRIQPIGSWRT